MRVWRFGGRRCRSGFWTEREWRREDVGVETDAREGAERFKLDGWMDATVCLTFRSWETTH